MTTRQQMKCAIAVQREVIAVLHAMGQTHAADRLRRCMAARQGRRSGGGWPRTCRSAGCAWCRSPLIRAWWSGMCNWSAPTTSSLAIIPAHSPAGLRQAVRRLRRGLRDVRDRMARRRRHWRGVCFAGMASGDGTVMVLVLHDGVGRHEVLEVLRRRWPEIVVKSLAGEAPRSAMTADNAADLARSRRGVEPLRLVILRQRDQQPATSPPIEPMPVVI
jgi:hypothetical protein